MRNILSNKILLQRMILVSYTQKYNALFVIYFEKEIKIKFKIKRFNFLNFRNITNKKLGIKTC